MLSPSLATSVRRSSKCVSARRTVIRSSTATSMAISDNVALPASHATSSLSQGTVSIDVAALSATVSAVVTEALKTALSW